MDCYNFTFLFCGLLMPEAGHQHRAVRYKLPRLSSALPLSGNPEPSRGRLSTSIPWPAGASLNVTA